MDLLAERGRRISVDELNTTRLLAHARSWSSTSKPPKRSASTCRQRCSHAPTR